MADYDPNKDANNGKVTVGTTSTTVRAANPARKFLFLCNDGTETIYVSLGSAAVMNTGIRLNAGGGSTIINEQYTGVVSAICASGSMNLTFSENSV